ncbi:MAG: FkbM family methyltransferase [Bacteroidia bacterium]|nr:FkbM family methyltransferase [Bacteroidia bacterium]
MKYLINRVKVYTIYFYEYLRHAEFISAVNAVLYMFTRKSFSKGKQIKSSMGIFETRKGTLDFQYINYAYEIEIKHFIEKQQFDIFFDIGACLGEYCIWLGHKGYRCMAFEPVYDSYYMISKNIMLNNVEDKVAAYNYGLGSKHSVEHFELNQTNPGANKRVDEGTENTQKFEINAMDDVFETFGLKPETKILMKIDVEGMEVEMLKGATKFFRYFNNITLIIEEKLTGESRIINTLNEICAFEYGNVDNFNIYAKKLTKHQ